MRIKIIILTGCLIAALAGCGDSKGRIAYRSEELDKLRTEVTELTAKVEQYQAENEQLKKQKETLSCLKPEVKAENLYSVNTVRIHRYTNLFDKNKDGKKETLVVYIQPTDAEGDTIKASGSVDIELWNLNNESSNAKIAQWHVEPAELKEKWYSALMINTYRLNFDVAEIVGNFDKPLTVKVSFTDYLSGKVFIEQTVIKP